VVKETQAYPTE